MKSIRVHQFGGPDVLKLEDVSQPQPGPDQVVVGLHAVGVNPVETYVRAGSYGPRAFPFTPGSDGAGVIEALGAAAKNFKIGDRVYLSGSISGTYAAKALCTVPQIHPLPDKVTFEQGAAVGVPYATAYRAIHIRALARAGETVLIHGASGGVGTAAVQLCRLMGMTVVGTGGTEEGRRLVAEQGAHHVLDHRADDYLKQAMDLTDGRGFDLILEMLANVNLDKDLGLLAKQGRVVVIGNRGRVEIDPRQSMSRDASILGMTLLNATEQELVGIHAAIGAGLENGTLRPVIGKKFPLAEAAKAHKEVLKPGAYGKIILIP